MDTKPTRPQFKGIISYHWEIIKTNSPVSDIFVQFYMVFPDFLQYPAGFLFHFLKVCHWLLPSPRSGHKKPPALLGRRYMT